MRINAYGTRHVYLPFCKWNTGMNLHVRDMFTLRDNLAIFFPILFIWRLCFVHMTAQIWPTFNLLHRSDSKSMPSPPLPKKMFFFNSCLQPVKFKIQKDKLVENSISVSLLIMYQGKLELCKFCHKTNVLMLFSNFKFPVVCAYHLNLYSGEK